jgi:hypothetical protein
MGTALVGADKDAWTRFLRNMRMPSRDRFRDALCAAPLLGSAYTIDDFERLASVADVATQLEDVEGFRAGDRLYFVQYWREQREAPDESNRPVISSRVEAAVSASVARGDTAVQTAAAATGALDKGMEVFGDIEGKSVMCWGSFRLKLDSSKWGKLAELGSKPEEADYLLTEKGFEVATVEWPKHTRSRPAWMEYSRKLKAKWRTHKRYGLIDQLTGFNDYLEEMCGRWALAHAFIHEYFELHEGYLPVTQDAALFTKVSNKWDQAGKPTKIPATGGMVWPPVDMVEEEYTQGAVQGGPPPKAIKGPGAALDKRMVSWAPDAPPGPPEPTPPSDQSTEARLLDAVAQLAAASREGVQELLERMTGALKEIRGSEKDVSGKEGAAEGAQERRAEKKNADRIAKQAARKAALEAEEVDASHKLSRAGWSPEEIKRGYQLAPETAPWQKVIGKRQQRMEKKAAADAAAAKGEKETAAAAARAATPKSIEQARLAGVRARMRAGVTAAAAAQKAKAAAAEAQGGGGKKRKVSERGRSLPGTVRREPSPPKSEVTANPTPSTVEVDLPPAPPEPAPPLAGTRTPPRAPSPPPPPETKEESATGAPSGEKA